MEAEDVVAASIEEEATDEAEVLRSIVEVKLGDITRMFNALCERSSAT